MREIKYRYVLSNGKDIVLKTFTLDEIQDHDTEWIYEQFENEFGGECTCMNESCNHCECGTVFDDYNIIDREQFTGLTDKNKNEVYEGDRVKAKYEYSGEETTEEGCWNGFTEYYNGAFHINTGNEYNPNISNTCIIEIEVIGNKHDGIK